MWVKTRALDSGLDNATFEPSTPVASSVCHQLPFVDVLSFQDFRDPVGHLDQWYAKAGMPVLWADGAHGVKLPDGDSRNNGKWYAEVLAGLQKNPGCIGAHLCGAYYRNRVRRRGLLDENEQPDKEMIDHIRKANNSAQAWVTDFGN